MAQVGAICTGQLELAGCHTARSMCAPCCGRHTAGLRLLWGCAGCSIDCTGDGLHYSNVTYDAGLQIFLNQLQTP